MIHGLNEHSKFLQTYEIWFKYKSSSKFINNGLYQIPKFYRNSFKNAISKFLLNKSICYYICREVFTTLFTN